PGPLAILVRGSSTTSGFALEHIRYQSMGYPTDLANRSVYWLGEVDEQSSVEWLRGRIPGARPALRPPLVEAVGLHADDALVVPWLDGVRRREVDPEMRRAAVDALGRHPGQATETALIESARTDRSERVRMEATESLGRLGTPGAMTALLEIS